MGLLFPPPWKFVSLFSFLFLRSGTSSARAFSSSLVAFGMITCCAFGEVINSKTTCRDYFLVRNEGFDKIGNQKLEQQNDAISQILDSVLQIDCLHDYLQLKF
mmetsp:Transcript_58910/g.144086  ORF Transcript_58910/g.144086 Transcript_58910/m.144086 type:complete len:103 (-) Transcript_58910:344-652(-)